MCGCYVCMWQKLLNLFGGKEGRWGGGGGWGGREREAIVLLISADSGYMG